MENLRVETDDLPDFRYPVNAIDSSPSNPFGFMLVQGKEDDKWLPKWLIVDSDGYAIGRIEADSFEGLDPEAVARKAFEFVFEMHELGEEASKMELQQLGGNYRGDSSTYGAALTEDDE